MAETVLVTGATGHLGKMVIGHLLDRMPRAQISAFARNLEKAQELEALGITIKLGNYDDPASMVNAFRGIDKLYLVSANEIGKRLQQQINAIQAARQAGVKHVFFTSFQRTTEGPDSPLASLGSDYIRTETELIGSGLTHTILKHALYLEVILPLCEQALRTGMIYTPAGEGKVSFAARSDLAEAAAHVLTTFGHENEVYEFAGPLSYSYADIAAILGELSGKQISYISPAQEEYQREQARLGIPPERSRSAILFGEAIRLGEFDHPDPTLEMFLGRTPLDPREFLRTNLGL